MSKKIRQASSFVRFQNMFRFNRSMLKLSYWIAVHFFFFFSKTKSFSQIPAKHNFTISNQYANNFEMFSLSGTILFTRGFLCCFQKSPI